MKAPLAILILLVLAFMQLPVLALSDGMSVEYVPAAFNLGIGKISPAAKLDVNGTTATIGLTLNGNSFSIAPSLSQGSLLFAKANGAFRQLIKGTNHHALKVNGNTLSWESASVSAGSGATNIDGLTDGKSSLYDVALGAGGAGTGFPDSGDSYSTVVGFGSVSSNHSQSLLYNSAFGYRSNTAVRLGAYNTTSGDYSLREAYTSEKNTASGYNALYSWSGVSTGYNDAGDNNTVSGSGAIYTQLPAYNNTVSGFQSTGSSSSNLSNNTVSGYQSLYIASGNIARNTVSGYQSLSSRLGNISSLTGIGYRVMYSNTTGSSNTGLGNSSLYYNVTGTDNTAVGHMAGEGSLNNSFSSGSFLGYSTGAALTTGSNNTMLGYGAGIAVTNGNGNILLGYQAGDNINTGARNIIIGHDVDAPSVSNRGQLVIGNLIYGNGMTATGTTISSGKVGIRKANPAYTLDVNGSMTFSKAINFNGNALSVAANLGQGSILFAKQSGIFAALDNAASSNHKVLKVNGNTLAWESVFRSGVSDIDGLSDGKSNLYNVYLGNGAGASDSGTSYSTGVGIKALQNNISGSGLSNSAFGYMALNGNTSGDDNTGIGYQSLYSNTTGSLNTAMGYQSLYSNIDGMRNTAIGANALYSNTSGSDNVAMGLQALIGNTSGSDNVAMGYQALYSNTSGSDNVAMGYQALYSNTSGSDNVVVGNIAGNSGSFSNGTILGYGAGASLTTGNNNILIGYRAGLSLNSGSRNIIIGNEISLGSTVSNQINIGNTIYGNSSNGNVGIGTSNTSLYKLIVQGTAGLTTGTAWTNTSDIRLKNIDGDYEYGLAEILKLHSVRFHYQEGNPREMPSDIPLIGFIAQEVQPIFPEAVHVGRDGYLDFNIHPISVAMVNAMQELTLRTRHGD